jgi:hypothetical protein
VLELCKNSLFFTSSCLLCTIAFRFLPNCLKEDMDSILDFLFSKERSIDPVANDSLPRVVSIAFLTKLNFEKVDKRVSEFAEDWGNDILHNPDFKYNPLDIQIPLSAFADLLLTNVSFFQEKFFPNLDLHGIENELQVSAVIQGKYFTYLSHKKFCRDLNFRFE